MEFENIIRCYEGEKLQMDLAASNTKVPIAVPDINEEDAESVRATVMSGWVSGRGKNILDFEQE